MGLVSDHPVCGASVASRLFINAAATPPHEEGNVQYLRLYVQSHPPAITPTPSGTIIALPFALFERCCAEGESDMSREADDQNLITMFVMLQ
jgi:hypothetical protein